MQPTFDAFFVVVTTENKKRKLNMANILKVDFIDRNNKNEWKERVIFRSPVEIGKNPKNQIHSYVGIVARKKKKNVVAVIIWQMI